MTRRTYQPPECSGIGHRHDLHAARRHISHTLRTATHNHTPTAKPPKTRDKIGYELRPLRLWPRGDAKKVHHPDASLPRQREPRQQPDAMNPHAAGGRKRHVATQPAEPDIRHQASVETPDEQAKHKGDDSLNPPGGARRHVRMKLMSDENAHARTRPDTITIVGHYKVRLQPTDNGPCLTMLTEY